jgi:hypothetical protein
LGDKRSEYTPLNAHTLQVLSDTTLRVNSFTLTSTSVSFCVSRRSVRRRGNPNTVGMDRNLHNVTAGDDQNVTCYDITRVVEISATQEVSLGHSSAAMRESDD